MSRFEPVLRSPRTQRAIQAAALGFGIGFALISIRTGIVWTDGQVYWTAAERLRAGDALYPTADPETAYKYAPWFAWAWVLLTFLPEPVVAVGWTVAMVAAWTVPLPAFSRAGWQGRSLAFLAAPPLLVAALGGNVQPAVVALLYVGLARRWGLAAIGLTASLKIFPILFALVYAAQRQWWRAGMAVGLGAVLWLPAFAYGIEDYPAVIGGAFSLWTISPVLYLAGIGLVAAWTWRARSWSAAGLLVLVASVRFIPYHLGYLLCSPPRPPEAEQQGPA